LSWINFAPQSPNNQAAIFFFGSSTELAVLLTLKPEDIERGWLFLHQRGLYTQDAAPNGAVVSPTRSGYEYFEETRKENERVKERAQTHTMQVFGVIVALLAVIFYCLVWLLS
jgi:hypothetical protein